jgi:hypothetical protein
MATCRTVTKSRNAEARVRAHLLKYHVDVVNVLIATSI